MPSETDKLLSELTSKIISLQERVNQLENRLSTLENRDTPISSNANLEPTKNASLDRIKPITDEAPKQPQDTTASAAKNAVKPLDLSAYKIVKTTTENDSKKSDHQSNNAPQNNINTTPTTPAKPVTPPEPRVNPFAGLLELLTMLFGPFSSVIHQVLKVYNRYQKQGKGPAFLMTASGILALVMGFGFLMQYSFSNYLGIGGKITVGFISSIALVVLGMRISNKRTMLSEFGAALIGLGIILNYLCAYFISGYFNIVGPTVGLGLLAAITFAAYWLAVHYDTKTVAILSLLGGASTPLFLGDIAQATSVYFIYLTFLVVAMLHLAYKIKWPNLIQFTLIVCAAMTQYLFFEQGGKHLINNTLFIVLLHILFYSFSYACLHNISKSGKTVDKPILLTIVGNIIFFVFVLYQSISVDQYLGITYLVNAVALLLFYKFNWLIAYADKKIKNNFNALLILQTGLLVGFGILYLVSPSLLGLIWGVEGLALVYVGFRFAIPSIRYEGHFAFLIGMGSAGYEAIRWFSDGISYQYGSITSITLSYNTGWMNLIVFGVVLWLAARLLQHFREQCLEWEKTICLWSHEIFSIWLSLAFMISMLVIASDELLLLSIVPLFLLLYRARKYNLAITEFLGLAHYFLFVAQILISAEQVNSFSLSQQNWIGIAVRIEAFLCLWLIAEFYSRFYPKSIYASFARVLRIIFYVLIPLLFIPKLIKTYDAFLPIGMWLSAAIALFLHTRVKYHALRVEFYILTAMAWGIMVIASIAEYNGLWHVEAGYALLSGLIYFAFINLIWKAFSTKSLKPISTESAASTTEDSPSHYDKIKNYVLLHNWSVYYVASCIAIVTFGFTGNILLTILFTSIYFALLCESWPKIVPANNNLQLSYLFLIVLSILTLLITAYSASTLYYSVNSLLYLIAQVALIGYLLYKKSNTKQQLWSYFGGHNSQIHMWSIFYVALSLFIITVVITDNVQLSILICSAYYFTLITFWPNFAPATISLKFSYGFLIIFSFLTLILTSNFYSPLYLLAHAGVLGYLLHSNSDSSKIIKNYLGGYGVQLWGFNVFAILVYTSSLFYWIPDQLRIVLSILLVLHATVLLMLTLREGFESLLKLSVILFVGAAIKILMFDMADFSLVQKIIAFMIIGAMLLGASYLYQKMQQKVNPIAINTD